MRRIGGSLEGVSVVMGGSAGFTARLVAALGWGEVVVVVAMVVVLLATRIARYIWKRKVEDDDANTDLLVQPRIAYRMVHKPTACSERSVAK